MNYEINEFGTKRWYKEGQLHREDGPAVEWVNGDKCWFKEGKYHREDGPAVELANGDKLYYYLHKHIKCSSDEEYFKLLKLKAFW